MCGIKINLKKYISPGKCVKKCNYLHLKIFCKIAKSFFLLVTSHENSQPNYKKLPPTLNFVNFVQQIFNLKKTGPTSNGHIYHQGKYLYVQFMNLIKIIYDDVVGNIIQTFYSRNYIIQNYLSFFPCLCVSGCGSYVGEFNKKKKTLETINISSQLHNYFSNMETFYSICGCGCGCGCGCDSLSSELK